MNLLSLICAFCLTVVVPAEIRARGEKAKLIYEKVLREGFVKVYRGRILLIGQDRAGKTSLKKSLLGLPFDPREESTDGIAIDPSKFEIEVDHIKPWKANHETSTVLSDVSRDISRLLAEERYHSLLSTMESGEELSGEESKVETKIDSDTASLRNQVGTYKLKLKLLKICRFILSFYDCTVCHTTGVT